MVFNAAGELLLLRRANTGFMEQGHYALCRGSGGHRQTGEAHQVVTVSPRAKYSATRPYECREEARVDLRHGRHT